MESLFEIVGPFLLILLGGAGVTLFNRRNNKQRADEIKAKHDPKLKEMESNLNDLEEKAKEQEDKLDEKAKIDELSPEEAKKYWDKEL